MTNVIQNNIPVLQKVLKYILMGLIIIVAVKYIPDNLLNIKEIIMIGAISSISFAILDMVSPSVKIITTKPEEEKKVLVEAMINV